MSARELPGPLPKMQVCPWKPQVWQALERVCSLAYFSQDAASDAVMSFCSCQLHCRARLDNCHDTCGWGLCGRHQLAYHMKPHVNHLSDSSEALGAAFRRKLPVRLHRQRCKGRQGCPMTASTQRTAAAQEQQLRKLRQPTGPALPCRCQRHHHPPHAHGGCHLCQPARLQECQR